MIPKVIFKITDYDNNWNFLKSLYLGESDTLDFNKYITDLFPELKSVDPSLSKEEHLDLLKREFDREWEESIHLFEDSIDEYNNIWESINDNYMSALSNHLNIKWPSNFPTITCDIGLYPVFPRYLEEFRFCIYPGLKSMRVINVIAHELLHFLWFYKWKELHPEFIISDNNPQDNIWKYSEIVVDPILNSNEIKSVLNIDMDMKTYDIFYEMMDGDKNIVSHLNDIYNENISIEEKIEKGFIYINNILE